MTKTKAAPDPTPVPHGRGPVRGDPTLVPHGRGPVRGDPTLPTSAITIEGREYWLCFDLGALAQAEEELNAPTPGRPNGHDVNLLFALPGWGRLTLKNTRVLFAASLRKFQPEIACEDALALLTQPYLLPAVTAIIEAYNLGAPDPPQQHEPVAGGPGEPEKDGDETNPTEPGA